MVGFGSSLRRARRPGWEGAYLDYESLKLLLSQIEAIYEEEAHRRNHQQDGSCNDWDYLFDKAAGSDTNDGAPAVVRDYRDELFLESDSDAAFQTLMEFETLSADERHDGSDAERDKANSAAAAAAGSGAHHQSVAVAGHPDMESMIHMDNQHAGGGANGSGTMGGVTNPPFSMTTSFSQQETQDHHTDRHHHRFGGYEDFEDDYDDDDSQDDAEMSNCVPLTSVAWGRQSSRDNKKKKSVAATAPTRQSNQFLSSTTVPGESEFFISSTGRHRLNQRRRMRGNADANTFILEEESSNHDDEEAYQGAQDDGAANARGELAPLLPPLVGTTPNATIGGGSPSDGAATTLYSFASLSANNYDNNTNTNFDPVTPPQRQPRTSSFLGMSDAPLLPNTAVSTFYGTTNTAQSVATAGSFSTNTSATTRGLPPGLTRAQAMRLEEQRRQERRERRKRRRLLARKRKELEQKVPRHIRVAHTKAREITERFLGLLRAECEKVMLFAQSRLGELADTVGSLRFSSMDDGHHPYNTYAASASSSHRHHHQQHRDSSAASARSTTSYEYHLSEGGLHPSASSSSDEGAGGWSDSSDDDGEGSTGPNINLDFSTNGLNQLASSQTDGGPQEFQSPQRALAAMVAADDQTPEVSHKTQHQRLQQNQKHDGFHATKRHLDHFEKLRRNRPIFQRNSQIVGEDMLLLSVVDEVDGYTAVGVELMHVLRFIGVNLIAVRKICRKHDRLLMNRMLGGYYHHLRIAASLTAKERRGQAMDRRSHHPHDVKEGHIQNAHTLGGLLARQSGDIFEAHHPAVIGQINNYKLVGLYDKNLQELANARTVQVISSCLVLALSEYEVSRSRAHALATLNAASKTSRHKHHTLQHPQDRPGARATFRENVDTEIQSEAGDSDGDDGPPSTASSISLTRLRFTVTSTIALREATRRKNQIFATYLSRTMLSFTGRAVVGEGLDGCSRETLDFLVSYNPDAALLMDPAVLADGLKQGMWSKRSISSVMASSLAVATIPMEASFSVPPSSLVEHERAVSDALNMLPKLKFVEIPELFKSQVAAQSRRTCAIELLENDMFGSVLKLNRISYLLHTMNYYVVHPTTISFVRGVGAPPAHSALIIGIPSLSAMLAALFNCYILSGDMSSRSTPVAAVHSLKWPLLAAAFLGVVGNVVHGIGIWHNSVPEAVLGRFFYGFSSAEILHRHIVAYCVPVNRVVAETANLVQFQITGMLCGLLIGSLAEFLPFHIPGWGIRSLSSSSFLMAVLWMVHLVHICARFKIAPDVNRVQSDFKSSKAETVGKPPSPTEHDSGSSDPGGQNDDSPPRQPTKKPTYGTSESILLQFPKPKDSSMESSIVARHRQQHANERKRRVRVRKLKTFPSKLRRLLNYSFAVPVCLFLALYMKYAEEILFTSCPVILDRYFESGGDRAGLFLAFLTATILPTNFICGHIARKYEERTIVKRSLFVLAIGLFAMVNFGSIISLAFQIKNLLSETDVRSRTRVYDWLLGILQYILGLTITFIALTSTEGAALSLLSKVSPPHIKSSNVAVQLGTIVSFVNLTAKLIADCQILVVGLSNRIINTDLVNSLVVPLLLICLIAFHLVRKHYFFLM